jgi:murein tripeptide amidase MpaA
VFWLQARIHGNELHSTEAVLQILKYLGSSGSAEAKRIRDALTVIVIPMYNPDGATANIRQSTTPLRIDLTGTGSSSASRSRAPSTSCGRSCGRGLRSTCTTSGRPRACKGRTS